LWEGYGVDVDKDSRQRETGGIQKVVAITDDFEHVVGFEREEREVNAWLDWHGYSSTQDRSISESAGKTLFRKQVWPQK